ncbi:MAG: hypothetical protein IPJ95_09270 [Gemmatimonadetes bacterium]|nr:hypothetical protein [Gemmatimonadota bacterium]
MKPKLRGTLSQANSVVGMPSRAARLVAAAASGVQGSASTCTMSGRKSAKRRCRSLAFQPTDSPRSPVTGMGIRRMPPSLPHEAESSGPRAVGDQRAGTATDSVTPSPVRARSFPRVAGSI